MADFKIKIITDASNTVAGSKQAAAALNDVGKDAEAAGKVMQEADDKSFASKKQLKDAVKGLAAEFPVLAHYANLALNPITFVVSGVGGAFALWQAKVEGVTRALAGVEMPDINPKQIGLVTAAAEAYKSLAEAAEDAAKAYNSVDAASDRASKKIAAEIEQKKRLMVADKNLELAYLEADKNELSVSEYERRKRGIEDKYAGYGVAMTAQEKQLAIEEKADRAKKLRADAEAKATEAGKIRVGTAVNEGNTEAELKKAYDKALASQAARRQRIMDMVPLRDKEGPWYQQAWQNMQMRWNYGLSSTPTSAIEMEQSGMAEDQNPIDRYRRFMQGKEGRADLRKRQGQLSAEAGKELGEAKTLEADLPKDQAAANQEVRIANMLAQIESLTRAAKGVGELQEAAKSISDQMAAATAGGTKILYTTVDKLAALNAAIAAAEKRLLEIEAKTPTSY